MPRGHYLRHGVRKKVLRSSQKKKMLMIKKEQPEQDLRIDDSSNLHRLMTLGYILRVVRSTG